MEFIKEYNEKLNETIYKATHSTGLKIYVIPKEGFAKKYAVIGTKFGSVNNRFIPLGKSEPIDIPDGVAHFLEHKMFEQSDGSNAFDKFSEYGANANAFTSFTTTCYLFSCTDYFYENLEHLLSYVQDPYYTDENVSKEQGIIGQEIRMYDDDGQWQVMINQLKALYKNHPVNRDIAGDIESISKIDKELLYDCYNTYYNPKNMVLTVCGDVDVQKVLDTVDKLIRCDVKTGDVVSIFPDEPKEIAQKLIETSSSVSRPLFSIGFKDNVRVCGTELMRREMAIGVLTKLLVGRSSPLYSEMYSMGLINEEFGTDIMCEEEFSCISLIGESNEPLKVRDMVMAEIEKIKQNGFDKSAVERIKKANMGSFLRNFNDTEDIAGLVARNALCGIDAFEYFDVYDTVSYDYLTQVFNEIFCDEYMAVSIVNPIG